MYILLIIIIAILLFGSIKVGNFLFGLFGLLCVGILYLSILSGSTLAIMITIMIGIFVIWAVFSFIKDSKKNDNYRLIANLRSKYGGLSYLSLYNPCILDKDLSPNDIFDARSPFSKSGNGVQYYDYASRTIFYKCEFLYNYKNGYGVEYYESGAILYKGEFKNNEKCGKGTMFDLNGTTLYSGVWYNSVPQDY